MMRSVIWGVVAAAMLTAPAVAKDKKDKAKAPPAAFVSTIPPLTPENTWTLDLSNGGKVVVQLRPDKAPLAVERIKTLTQRGFYNGLIFHRVIDGFMAQGGDPKGTGEGGSELPDLKAEFNDMPHVRGEVAMARAQARDSANSQFFIMLMPNLSLDGKYSPFGRVVSGIDAVDAIEKGEPPANPTRIVRASLGDNGASLANAAPAAAAAPAAVAAPESAAAPASSARDVERAIESVRKTTPSATPQ